MEFTLLAAALTGMAALWVVLRLSGAGSQFDVTVTATVVGLFTGRLVAMVLSGVNPIAHPLDVLAVRGGVDTVGATAGALAYLVGRHRSHLPALATLGPAALAGLAGWHAGCLWRGTCLGAAGDIPWGWTLAGSEVVRHPVELYAAALLVAAAWAVAKYPGRGGAGMALAAAACARLITEPLRPALGGDTAWWYAAGVAAGVAWMVMERLRAPAPASRSG